MWTWRSCLCAWARIASLAGGLLVAGCTDHGNYRVSWTFVGNEAAGVGCGRHGVDAIRVTGASTQGDGEDVVTLCTGNDGLFTHGVPTGNWAFTIHQLDVRGRPISVPQLDDQGQPVLDANGYPTFVPDPTATATIAKDATVDLYPVVLTPRPECSDGVDNDGDRRVDLDDPDCAGASNVNTATECGPGEDC